MARGDRVLHEVDRVCARWGERGEVGGQKEPLGIVGKMAGVVLGMGTKRQRLGWIGSEERSGGWLHDLSDQDTLILEESPLGNEQAGEIPRAEVAAHDGGDERTPQPTAHLPEGAEIASSCLA